MVNREELQNLSVEELRGLKQTIEELIKEKTTPPNWYEFTFQATIDPRKGIPYVAKLTVDSDGKLQREFYQLDKTRGKKEVTVFGTFKAREGDIIEQREGASWKNDYRSWYAVVNGKMVEVASVGNSAEQARVVEYLKGKRSLDEIIPKPKEGR